MRPVDDKGCYNHASAHDGRGANPSNFEFPKGNGTSKAPHNRKALGSRSKPTPSKWDDAQKWLVGLSGGGGDHGNAKNKGRNSDADDLRLIRVMSQKGRNSCSSMDEGLEEGVPMALTIQDRATIQEEGETKKIDCSEPSWRASNPAEDSSMAVKSFYVRDVGTEMTPIASQEPSRTTTPLRATTPSLASPIASGSSTPRSCHQVAQPSESYQQSIKSSDGRNVVVGRSVGNGWPIGSEEDADGCKILRDNGPGQVRNLTALESRAVAWDEAERAKYTARYKREEVKIQAWENHEKRKAETEMKRIEVKAERLKSRAQEKLANKLAATRRMAEDKRANAEAELNEQASKTTEKAEYIRRMGHLPSSFFSLKLPSLCS